MEDQKHDTLMILLGNKGKDTLEDIDLISKKQCLPIKVHESCIFIKLYLNDSYFSIMKYYILINK